MPPERRPAPVLTPGCRGERVPTLGMPPHVVGLPQGQPSARAVKLHRTPVEVPTSKVHSSTSARDRMPWGGGQPDARQLTAAIENCRGVRELARILREQKRALGHVHVSAAWVRLASNGTVWGEGDVREAVVALQDRSHSHSYSLPPSISLPPPPPSLPVSPSLPPSFHARQQTHSNSPSIIRTWGVLDHAGGRGVANVMHSMAKLKQMGVRVDQRLRLAMQVGVYPISENDR